MKGFITISRMSSNYRGDRIEIRLRDDASHVHFLEVQMTMEEFGNAVTGVGHRPCEFEVQGLELLGKVREHKWEVLPWCYHSKASEEHALSLIAPLEVDGWKGSVQDYLNSNNRATLPDGSSGRRVGFVRYVDPEPTENS